MKRPRGCGGEGSARATWVFMVKGALVNWDRSRSTCPTRSVLACSAQFSCCCLRCQWAPPHQLALLRQTAKSGPPSCRSQDTFMEPAMSMSSTTSWITMKGCKVRVTLRWFQSVVAAGETEIATTTACVTVAGADDAWVSVTSVDAKRRWLPGSHGLPMGLQSFGSTKAYHHHRGATPAQ
eukprot:g21171.t1